LASELILRGERDTDFNDIYEINKQAFGREDEAKLINALRKTRNYVKGFSIVALQDDKIVGHAIFTHAAIMNQGKRFNCLALGPMAVLPELQRKGIGKKLVEEGILRAKENNFKAIVVIGHSEYYPKFGFIPASTKKIRSRFNVPDENFMVIELNPNALKGITGLAEYAKEFSNLKPEPPKPEVLNAQTENQTEDKPQL
jgi:putative acetyltransferase